GHLRLAGDPGEQLAIRQLDQLLELGQLVRAEILDRDIGEAAHDQVHLPHAPMPGAEQELAPAHIQSVARTCRAGHRSLGPRATPKARTGRAKGHIATLTRDVSALLRDQDSVITTDALGPKMNRSRHPRDKCIGYNLCETEMAMRGSAPAWIIVVG